MLFAENQTFCLPKFWAGYATDLPWWNSYIVTYIHALVVFPVSSEISDLVRDFAWRDKRNFWPLQNLWSIFVCQLFRLPE